MFVQKGNHKHDLNEVDLDIKRVSLRDKRGFWYGIKYTWVLSGQLQAETSQKLTGKINALIAAYSFEGEDVVLYNDNGQPTAHALYSADYYTGVRVASGPDWKQGPGQYTTFRDYTITLEAEGFNQEGEQPEILEWGETLRFTGNGGPRVVFLEPLNGPVINQQVSQASVFSATQEGRAVGLTTWPTAPGPLFPDALMNPEVDSTPGPPKEENGILLNYPISWRYVFRSVGPLIGVPNTIPP